MQQINRAIIQARMGSSRLRGKSLSPIHGIPLLKRVYQTIANFEFIDDIVVASSNLEEDDPIAAYCENMLSCQCYRGSNEDVFDRFLNISKMMNEEDVIMRITADNIFYQADICKALINIHISNNNDYTGIKGLSHIVGEFLSVRAVRRAGENKLSEFEKEHVTPVFINNSNLFRTHFFIPSDFGLISDMDSMLTIDTEEDRDRIENLLIDFDQNNIPFEKDNLYSWLTNNK
jgi:spore coat polysaccharide biosynthesis protein SpsF